MNLHYSNSICNSLKIESSSLIDQLDCLVASQHDVPHDSSFEKDALCSNTTPRTKGRIMFVPHTIVYNDPSPSL